jgi:hypothetical protein
VIQTASGEDAEAGERPAWQWLLLGAACELTVFFPLSVLAVPLGVGLGRHAGHATGVKALLAAVPVLVAFAFAAWAAGAIIGRFALLATRRTAAFAGALGALVILLLVSLRGGLSEALLLTLVSALLLGLGASFAELGARFGRRRRPGAKIR